MNRISTIAETISLHGTNTINIAVLTITLDFIMGQYDKRTNEVKNFHTGVVMDNAVLWDYLPSFNETMFDEEMELLNS